jgi:hypothetical protein
MMSTCIVLFEWFTDRVYCWAPAIPVLRKSYSLCSWYKNSSRSGQASIAVLVPPRESFFLFWGVVTAATTPVANLDSGLSLATLSTCCLLCPQAWACVHMPCFQLILSPHSCSIPHQTSLRKYRFDDKIIKNFKMVATEHWAKGGAHSESWVCATVEVIGPWMHPDEGTCANLSGEAIASLYCKPDSTLNQETHKMWKCVLKIET